MVALAAVNMITTLTADAARDSRRCRALHQRHGADHVADATVVTIHGMSLTMYPTLPSAAALLLNRPLVDLAARRADAIITVSQSAKRDIMRLYGLPAGRVHVVHEAAAPSFHRVTGRAGAGARPSTVRAAGSLHPLCRHDRAAQESAQADRGVREAPGERRPAASARLRGAMRLALARHREAD